MQITPDEIDAFRQSGFLLVRRAVDQRIMRGLRAQILVELKRQSIWSGGRTMSNRLRGVPPFQQVTKLGQAVRLPSLSDAIAPPSLVDAIHALAGERLVADSQAQLLLSLPEQGSWTLDGLNWHRDVAPPKSGRSPGIQAFVLIDDVAPNGGATLALVGSHRLDRYQAVTYASERTMMVDHHRLSVLEMSGRSGDAYLMDLRLIHTPSINATKQVRMMATTRYFATASLP